MISSRAVASEVFASAVCNLNCNYCYIGKTKRAFEMQKDLLHKIKTGAIVDDLAEIHGCDIEHLSFWGNEPTVTLGCYASIFPQIFERFPKLANISFSTNFISGWESIVKAIEAVPEGRSVRFNIQASLDGPHSITDKNRASGATETIVGNMVKFAKSLNGIGGNKISINMNFKPTWGADDILYYSEWKSRLYEYFYFFDDVFERINSVFVNHKGPITVDLSCNCSPTLVLPGEYTQEDGVRFANVVKMIHEITAENHKKKLFKFVGGHLDSYYHRFVRVAGFYKEYFTKHGMFTCSAGDSSFAVGKDRDVHMCHRTFMYNDLEYLKEALDLKASGYKVWHVDGESIKFVTKNFVAKKDVQGEVERLAYVMGCYHNFASFKLNSFCSIVKELAWSGLIHRRYLEDDSFAMLFAIMMSSAFSCPADSLVVSSNASVVQSSVIKLFGNGAFDLIIDDVAKREM